MALLYIVNEKFSKGSIQNRNKNGNIWENFQKWVGGTKFGGEIPKFYLEIGSRGGLDLGLNFFRVNQYSHMHNIQICYTKIHFLTYNT